MLPCPSVLFSEFASLCLLLSGDVELNPGPDVKVMLKELCDGQKAIREELNDLGKRMGQVEKTLQIVKDQADALAKLTKTVNELNETVLRQQERMINLEDRSRRNNLTIFGIAEKEKESTDDLKSKVFSEVFKEKLGDTLTTVERIHRVGRKK